MRILLALAALTAACPAAAQDGEARVSDVIETSDGYRCRALEMPELSLSHDWRGTDRSASWEARAREAGAGDPRIRVAFRAPADSPTSALGSMQGFTFDMRRAPLRAPAKSALLRLDGISEPAVRFEIQGSGTSLGVAVVERQREELAARLMSVSIVELDLVDASGASLGRFSWDVRRLRRVEEVLQVINWSCR